MNINRILFAGFTGLVITGIASLFTACPAEPDTGGSTAAVNKTALEAAITEAEELLDSVIPSEDGAGLAIGDEWAPPAGYDTFKEAIDTAKAVYNSTAAVQNQINEAEITLNVAKAEFVQQINTVGPVNKTGLEASIQTAETLLASVKVLLDSTTPVGTKWVIQTDYSAFSRQIENAKAVFENDNASQTQVNQARTSLDAEKNDFDSCVKTVSEAPDAGSLIKFNASSAAIDSSTGLVNFGQTGERRLFFPAKADIKNDTISIQAKIKIISTSGHNGTGFVSVAGSTRKGYMMLTAQNIKNDGTGSSGQGMETPVSWGAGQEYIFKSEIVQGVISHYVYNLNGELVSQKANTKIGTYTNNEGNQESFGHLETDTVYASIGGTQVQQMEWSEIVVVRNGIIYAINSLEEQTMLPSLSLSAISARVSKNVQESVAYTAQAAGGTAAEITAVSADPATVKIDSYGSGVIVFTGLKAGTAEITVTNMDDTAITAAIEVTVVEFPSTDEYGVLSLVYPAAGTSGAYTDGELMITFDTVPKLEQGGSINIYEKASGVLADTILFADEKQTTLGSSNNVINVGPQLARVAANSIYFTPHFNKLEYGREYYIAIPSGAVTATLNSRPFTGLSEKNTIASWSFTTRADPDSSLNDAEPVTVDGAQNSRANFRTVYGALKAIASKGGNWTINVAPGMYTELIHYAGSSNVTINGMGSADYGSDVVIQYTNCNDMNSGTHTRPSFYFSGANLVLKNLTLKNTTVRGTKYMTGVNPTNNTQAETIYFANGTGRTFAAYNCSFLSHQDTIQTTGRNWFYKCYIEGDTDFIWGTADASLLEDCELVCVNDPLKTNSKDAILFVARTGSTASAVTTVGKGYILFKSKVKIENGMTAYFSRNPGPGEYYDQTAVIDTIFTSEGGIIAASIWNTSTYTFLAGAPEHVGWKLYNNTVDNNPQDVSGMPLNTSVIAQAVYNSEYNGRRTILNRVYKKSGGYEGAATVWDISALEAAFGASEDLSAANNYN